MAEPSFAPIPPGQTPPLTERERASLFIHRIFALTPRTPVSYVLIGISVLVYAAMCLRGVNYLWPDAPTALRWGADYGPLTTNGQWWRMLTSMFVHFGAIHIALNMWSLYKVGPFVERLFGSIGFLVVYLGSGLIGALASLTWNPLGVSAGASGAIFGLCGALLGFLVRRRASIPNQVLRRIGTSTVVVVALNVAIGLSIKIVDNSAHLGGLAGGFLLGFLVAQPITLDGAARRLRSSVVTALIAAFLVIGGAWKLPRVADLNQESQTVQEIISTTADRYNALVKEVEAGKSGEPDVSRLIETDFLPSLRAAQARFSHLGYVPKRNANYARLVRAYLQNSIEFYTTIDRGIQTKDENIETKIAALNRETERITKELEAAAQ